MVVSTNVPDCIERVAQFVHEKQLIIPQSLVVIGLSGGPDSVFLLHALIALQPTYQHQLIAAHLNHEWRASAIDDERLCQKLCDSLDIPLISARASQLAYQPHKTGSKEDIGRQLRRFFFQDVMRTHNAQHIALAHHADDQLETFFIRLIRGAHIAGLASIRPVQQAYIRPLLFLHKHEILDYLHKHNIHYAIDPTNSCSDFLRNRIRADLIPTLTAIDQRAPHNIKKAIAHLQETDSFLNRLACTAFEKLCLEGGTTIDINTLFELDPTLQKLVIMRWLFHNKITHSPSSSTIEEIMRFFRHTQSAEHRIGSFYITKKKHHATIRL